MELWVAGDEVANVQCHHQVDHPQGKMRPLVRLSFTARRRPPDAPRVGNQCLKRLRVAAKSLELHLNNLNVRDLGLLGSPQIYSGPTSGLCHLMS